MYRNEYSLIRKAPAKKMHLNMLSAYIVFWKELHNIIDLFK